MGSEALLLRRALSKRARLGQELACAREELRACKDLIFLLLCRLVPPSEAITLVGRIHSLVHLNVELCQPTRRTPYLYTMITRRLVLLLIIVYVGRFAAEAKVWNAQELAVGEWDVTLRGGWFFDPATIFPRSSPLRGGHQDNEQFVVRRRPWGSTVDCTLSVCQDGTFVLAPGKASPTMLPMNKNAVSTKHSKRGRLDLRGHWNVLSNPYCITDRFYDQLTLKSYSRATTTSTSSWRSGSMDLCCRLWGRHAKSDTMGRKGWMTHGTLVWKEHNKKNPFRPRRIVASFSAKRLSHEPTQGGWEDEEFFGY